MSAGVVHTEARYGICLALYRNTTQFEKKKKAVGTIFFQFVLCFVTVSATRASPRPRESLIQRLRTQLRSQRVVRALCSLGFVHGGLIWCVRQHWALAEELRRCDSSCLRVLVQTKL